MYIKSLLWVDKNLISDIDLVSKSVHLKLWNFPYTVFS